MNERTDPPGGRWVERGDRWGIACLRCGLTYDESVADRWHDHQVVHQGEGMGVSPSEYRVIKRLTAKVRFLYGREEADSLTESALAFLTARRTRSVRPPGAEGE